MSPLSWTFRQLLSFWVIAIGTAALLWAIGRRVHPGPWKLFWLLPARNVAHALWLASCAFFRDRPIEATAFLAVPLIASIVTVVWLAGRLAKL